MMHEALEIARNNRAISGALLITVIFNLFAFPLLAILPVVGEELLGLSAFGTGMITSCEGAGAFIGATLVARFAKRSAFKRIYWGGCLLYLAAILGIASFPVAVWVGCFLFLIGFGAAGVATMQSTLIYLMSPLTVRNRLMGILSLSVGTAPLGILHVGLLAGQVGTEAALFIMAIEGLLATAIVIWRWPEIR